MKKFLKARYVISAFLVLLLAFFIIRWQRGKAAEPTRYIMSQVTKGTIISSISGSGNVEAENSLDITPEVAGTVMAVYVKEGEEVTVGTPLIQIDDRDAQKSIRSARQSVRDAEISLESAQISYEKLIQPESDSTITKAQLALNQSQRNLQDLLDGPDELDVMKAQDNVRTAELNAELADDGITPKVVRSAYDKMVTTILTVLHSTQKSLDDANDVLAVDGMSGNINLVSVFSILDQSKKTTAYHSYDNAKYKLDLANDAIEVLAIRNEEEGSIDNAEMLMEEALTATETLLKDVKNGLESTMTSASFSQSSLDQYTSTIQTDINQISSSYSSLINQQDSIASAHNSYVNAQSNLKQAQIQLERIMEGADEDEIAVAREDVVEKEQALEDAKAGAEDIDIKSALNTIEQRKSALANAQENLQELQADLADYVVVAPFDGIIANLSVKASDKVSTGSSLATLLTQAKMAAITLNEVDVSKVKVGQKATLTFDAIPDLTIAGTVSYIDIVGSASQGVVSYTVKIAFLTDDERIKQGMTVSASIATDVATDVLQAPNAAIQGEGENAYVRVLSKVDPQEAVGPQGVTSDTPPEPKQVKTGLAGEQMTEIVSGLLEGDWIVTRSIDSSSVSSAATQSSSLRMGTGNNQIFRAAGMTAGGPPR